MATDMERSKWSELVAAQVRAERAALHLTQDELADRAGIPQMTYKRLERAQRVPNVTQIARLCGAFGIAQSTFYARVEERMQALGGDDAED